MKKKQQKKPILFSSSKYIETYLENENREKTTPKACDLFCSENKEIPHWYCKDQDHVTILKEVAWSWKQMFLDYCDISKNPWNICHHFFALLLISFYFLIFFIHICLSHNFPPIMTKEKQLFYCTRFSESSCKNVLWLIPHEIFFKILKKWISFLLNSMKYSDHFLIWFSKILHFSSLLHRGWTIDLDKITVSGLLILHLFSFKKTYPDHQKNIPFLLLMNKAIDSHSTTTQPCCKRWFSSGIFKTSK